MALGVDLDGSDPLAVPAPGPRKTPRRTEIAELAPTQHIDGSAALNSCGGTARTEGETDMQSKYPSVCVALVGEDENAFAIVERVQHALREAGVPTARVKAFTVEACSGDYYHLLETVLRTVETT